MVFMPPGSAKTRYASIVFVCWLLAQRERIDVIAASYNSEYAESVSYAIMHMVQDNAETLGYEVLAGTRKLWYTTKRGQYRAAGAKSGITGRRADVVLIDDPFKDREEADSPEIREKVWSWYRSSVVPRLKPGALIILIQTRWHHDDLAGRLLEAAKTGSDQWTVIDLPALAEKDDPMGREPGEALWPEWENEEALHRKRVAVGEREWSALYQQRPSQSEGVMFKAHMIPVVDAVPPLSNIVRSWDLAGTEKRPGNNPDWTVGLKMGRTKDGAYVVLDVKRFRGAPDEVNSTIAATAIEDGKTVTVRLPEEAAAAGKQLKLAHARLLATYRVVFERETGAKTTRAEPVASQANVGNVSMLRAPWNLPFRDELAEFPYGSFDDQVDALSGAFGVVGLGKQPMQVSAEAVAATKARAGTVQQLAAR